MPIRYSPEIMTEAETVTVATPIAAKSYEGAPIILQLSSMSSWAEVAVTILAIWVGVAGSVFAFWGYDNLKKTVKELAAQVATKTAAKTAKDVAKDVATKTAKDVAKDVATEITVTRMREIAATEIMTKMREMADASVGDENQSSPLQKTATTEQLK